MKEKKELQDRMNKIEEIVERYEDEGVRSFMCEPFGNGDSRTVYDLEETDYVAKVTNDRLESISQNDTECFVFDGASDEQKALLARIEGRSADHSLILMERASLKISEIDVEDFQYKHRELLDSLVKDFDLDEGELKKMDSWGIINETLVIIDYGCTTSTKKNFSNDNWGDPDETKQEDTFETYTDSEGNELEITPYDGDKHF